ncbi:MAG: hypothetical protein FWB95_02520 [Treponema sp.]|nr:hypothetical protein [Treponema sp.]
MSMNAADMKKAIISEINKEANSAANANKKFGDAILKYIVDNMEITYSWSATNPTSGASDPQTSFKASLSGSGTLGVSGSFAIFLVTLAAFIKSSIKISPAAGFTLAPLSFNPAGVITATQGKEDDPDKAMENFCSQIISSLKISFPNPAPSAGSHAAFTGATTKMVIA